jgi:Ser/Thr protein kinase RdoA (MazF antagonist)
MWYKMGVKEGATVIEGELGQEVLECIGCQPDTTVVEVLQSGENISYDVKTRDGRFIVRKYISKRYRKEQILSEIAWMSALKAYIDVPEPMENRDGEFVTEIDGIFYTAFCFIEGGSPTEEVKVTPAHYRRMGALVRDFRHAVGQVLEKASNDWVGKNRPHFTKAVMIEEPCQTLLAFDALADEDKALVERLAKRLSVLYEEMFASKPFTFVHADIHFGNILERVDGRWTLLDFDEGGFGLEAFDYGTIKMHTRFEKDHEPDELWRAFCEGHGGAISQAEVTLGAALRLFYMAGKIPKRLYIEALRKEPEVRLRRYFTEVEALLERVGK